jgi:beta-lactamase superfamily II metal-dependent hydrolase
MVLLVEFGNFRAIFSGDATGDTEKSAMANFGALINEVSVLLSSHHGASSHNSNHEDWAEATEPQTVIFSSGLSHRHPKKLAGERYLIPVFDDVTEHKIWWDPDSDGSTDTFDTKDAIYATEVSGRIVIGSDGNFFSLTCEKDGTESRVLLI